MNLFSRYKHRNILLFSIIVVTLIFGILYNQKRSLEKYQSYISKNAMQDITLLSTSISDSRKDIEEFISKKEAKRSTLNILGQRAYVSIANTYIRLNEIYNIDNKYVHNNTSIIAAGLADFISKEILLQPSGVFDVVPELRNNDETIILTDEHLKKFAEFKKILDAWAEIIEANKIESMAHSKNILKNQHYKNIIEEFSNYNKQLRILNVNITINRKQSGFFNKEIYSFI